MYKDIGANTTRFYLEGQEVIIRMRTNHHGRDNSVGQQGRLSRMIETSIVSVIAIENLTINKRILTKKRKYHE